jgi:hypothetical protein
MATEIDAKGDLIVGTGADAFARLAVGTNGHTLVADSAETTGLKWAAASSSALVLITTQSFSSSTTISVNDVFSATYTNYLVKMYWDANAGAGTGFEMRLRVSGSDNSTSNYAYQRQTTDGSGVSAARLTGQSLWEIGQASASETAWAQFDFYQPFATAETQMLASNNGGGATPQYWLRSCAFDATTSFTGFSVIAQRSLTGSLSVYGYAK